MPPRPRSTAEVRFTFEKGIDQSVEESTLPDGFLADVRNLEATPLGGLRVRPAWQQAGSQIAGMLARGDVTSGSNVLVSSAGVITSDDVGSPLWVQGALAGPADLFTKVASVDADGTVHMGANATRTVIGTSFRVNQSTNDQVSQFPTTFKVRGLRKIAVPKLSGIFDSGFVWVIGLVNPLGTDAEVWAIDGDLGDGSNWILVEQFTDPTVDDMDTFPIAFAPGTKAVLFSHPKAAGIRSWTGDIPATAVTQTASPPVRALAFFNGRFYAAGTDPDDTTTWKTPYRLYFSNVNSTGGWAGSGDPPSVNKNYLDIGPDDAIDIEDLAVFGSTLIIGKSNRIYALTGNTVDDFAVTPIEGMGAARGRSLVPTPKGLIVLGDEAVYLWNGGDPVILSDPVHKLYAEGAGGTRHGAYAHGLVKMASLAGGPQLVFDVYRGIWQVEEVGDDGARPVGIGSDLEQFFGGVRTSVHGPLLRQDPIGGPRQPDLYPGKNTLPTTYSFRSPIYRLSQPAPSTPRHVHVATRQRGTGTGRMVLTFLTDGRDRNETEKQIIADPNGEGWLRDARQDLGGTGQTFQIIGETDGELANPVTFDLEGLVAIIDVLPDR